jgi:hypothetical protein
MTTGGFTVSKSADVAPDDRLPGASAVNPAYAPDS